MQKQKPMVTFDQAFQAAQRKALGQAIASSITPPRVKDALRVVRRETK